MSGSDSKSKRLFLVRRALAVALAALLAAPCLHAAEPSTVPRTEVPFFSAGARLGAVAWGTGVQKNECAGPCDRFAPVDSTYSHSPAFVVGADALFGVLDRFRFGLGALIVPASDIRLAGAADDFAVGTDLGIHAVAEVVIRATPRVWVLPRLQGGPIGLFPGGDLRSLLDSLHRDYCVGAVKGCDSLTGSYWGWNVAAGAGALWVSAERVRLRTDLLVQYYAVPLYTLSARLAAAAIDVSERLTGARMLFTLGAEFL
jgi:hypothetical protein